MRCARAATCTSAAPRASISPKVAVKAHKAGKHNPYAQYRNEVTVEEVLGSRMIADPLSSFMCCPTGDGAAAGDRRRAERRPARIGRKPIRIAASALQSGIYKPGFRDMASSELTERTATKAYEDAGVGPEDIDVAEIHDAFSIAELMYYEALGFCAPEARGRLCSTAARPRFHGTQVRQSERWSALPRSPRRRHRHCAGL